MSEQAVALSIKGLTRKEADAKLLAVGRNELPQGSGRSLLKILLETFREPMFLLLMAAAALYLALGDLGEGLFLLAGACAAIGLVIFQDARSERALRALRDLSQPQVRVLRDGLDFLIPSAELVPGDIMLAGEGDRLAADGVLVAGDVLSVDESALTGESAPVSKLPATDLAALKEEAQPGAEASSFLFSGALIVRGQAIIQVTRTGAQSAIGRIGSSLKNIDQEQTPLQQATGRLVSVLGVLALGFCVLIALLYFLLRDDGLGGILAGITVAIALIPEEFPMVLAVFLALGAWRLARHQVLVRRSAVIETLGGATVLCVDKTGTLTENRMEVLRLWSDGAETVLGAGVEPEGSAAHLLHIAALASAVHPVDPMDRAVRAVSTGPAASDLPVRAQPERSWPLTRERLAVIQLWQLPEGEYLAAAKGAPEAVFRLCGMTAAEAAPLDTVLQRYASLGLRVLGVAQAPHAGSFPEDLLAARFRFSGFVAFADPLRQDVPAAISEAHRAGIEVAMITGDHPLTALAIAREAGLRTDAGCLTGDEMETMSFEDLCIRVKGTRIFARIPPGQKLRIVQAFRHNGEIVAMTGDGVNDAPALEAAHIGVAMGRRGTDVAREAADLVLLNDSFASIVGAVRMGRRIFSNLRRAVTYITAIHVPIAGLALLPIALGLPPLLFPMHIVLLELVIDPTCSVVFEAEPSDERAMQRPPRPPDEPLFGRLQIFLALLQGGSILAAVLGLYWSLLSLSGVPEAMARGCAFIALVSGNLVLALTDSAASLKVFAPHRRLYWGIVAAVAGLLVLFFSVQPLSAILAVSRPDGALLAIAVCTGLLSGSWTALRYLLPQRQTSPPAREAGA